jgi:hypothetical protein
MLDYLNFGVTGRLSKFWNQGEPKSTCETDASDDTEGVVSERLLRLQRCSDRLVTQIVQPLRTSSALTIDTPR